MIHYGFSHKDCGLWMTMTKIAHIEQIRNLPPTLYGWVQQLVSFDQPQLLMPHWRFPKQSLLPLHFPSSALHFFKLLQQESVLEWLKPQEKGSWQHFVPLHRFSSLLEFGSQMRPSRHWESFWHGPSLSPQSSFFVQSQPIWFLQSAWKIFLNMNSYNDQHCGLHVKVSVQGVVALGGHFAT